MPVVIFKDGKDVYEGLMMASSPMIIKLPLESLAAKLTHFDIGSVKIEEAVSPAAA